MSRTVRRNAPFEKWKNPVPMKVMNAPKYIGCRTWAYGPLVMRRWETLRDHATSGLGGSRIGSGESMEVASGGIREGGT